MFETATNKYKALTGQDLGTHPFAMALEDYNSPDPILEVFRKQAQTYHKFCKRDDKLMAYLTPVVESLFALSGALREGTCLVSFRSINTFWIHGTITSIRYP